MEYRQNLELVSDSPGDPEEFPGLGINRLKMEGSGRVDWPPSKTIPAPLRPEGPSESSPLVVS